MQAFRTSARVASQFRAVRGPKLVRGYAEGKSYEHLIVSEPKPKVGMSTYKLPFHLLFEYF